MARIQLTDGAFRGKKRCAAASFLLSVITYERIIFTGTEVIDVDVDHLELVPPPFCIYPVDGLGGRDGSRVTYKGYGLCLRKIDPRDLFGAEVDSPNRGNPLPAFEFKSYIRAGLWHLKVPLHDWADRGNDGNTMRRVWGHDSTRVAHLDGMDRFCRQLGEDVNNPVPAKTVVFRFSSSLDQNRRFDLNGRLLAVNSEADADPPIDELVPTVLSYRTSFMSGGDDDRPEIEQNTQHCIAFAVADVAGVAI